MARFTSDQISLALDKKGFVARAEAIEFLREMAIRMAVGHWSAGARVRGTGPDVLHPVRPVLVG